jgi:hypothetical protein
MTTARNVAIVLAAAAVVFVIPGGGTAQTGITTLLSIAMLATVAWFGARMYREHRISLYGLGDRGRVILYASVAIVVLTLTATSLLWQSGGGTLAWFVLLGLSAYGLYSVYRSARQY